MRCVYKVKSLLALRILCTGSEDSHRGGGRISQPSLFSAASSLRSQTSLQMAWETHMQALLQKWISESALGKKKEPLCWFYFSWLIYLTRTHFVHHFGISKSFLSPKVSLKKKKKNKEKIKERLCMLLPMRCFLNSELCLFIFWPRDYTGSRTGAEQSYIPSCGSPICTTNP